MIHWRIEGTSFPTNQSLVVRDKPYQLTTGLLVTSPATIGAALVQLIQGVDTVDQFFYFRNTSTAGQIIGIGGGNETGIGDCDMILYPGEMSPVHIAHAVSVYAIANAAGGTLYIWYRETQP